ncbi:MAG: zf-TFIIB domain-containing protein [Chloroflexi bacterium]|nr:zf-TFIIB domain-containing protein [Chloroflexota bacterium]
MNCENCGAPMRLVRNHDYYVCDYCGTFHHPDPNRDGVRVLGESSDSECPVCQLMLVTAALDRNPVLYCPNCRGILIHQAIFVFCLDYLRKRSKTPTPPQRFDPKELERPLRCPRCHRDMNTHPYGGPGNIVIDNCYTCSLVWLDYGELNRILTAPGEDHLGDLMGEE